MYIPLCFYIDQALLLLLCTPNFAHILVLLLYNLKNRLMSEGSCENHLQRNSKTYETNLAKKISHDIFINAKWLCKYLPLATDTEVNSCFSIYTKPQKVNFSTCHGCKPGCHFFLSCSKVNSNGYSEFD